MGSVLEPADEGGGLAIVVHGHTDDEEGEEDHQDEALQEVCESFGSKLASSSFKDRVSGYGDSKYHHSYL